MRFIADDGIEYCGEPEDSEVDGKDLCPIV